MVGIMRLYLFAWIHTEKKKLFQVETGSCNLTEITNRGGE